MRRVVSAIAAGVLALGVGVAVAPAASAASEASAASVAQAPAVSAATAVSAAFAAQAPAVSAATAVSAAPRCHPYPDVSSTNAHCGNIAWLKTKGITKPADGNYHPTSSVTRGSMTAFLYRLTHPGEAQPACGSTPFKDVATNSSFCGYIAWASSNGIAYGYSDGTYRAARPVTRGAMAAYLFRIANPGAGANACTAAPRFTDVAVNDLFCGVITWLVANKITYGVGDGNRYGTNDPVTRQSMASFLHRIDTLIDSGGGQQRPSDAGDDSPTEPVADPPPADPSDGDPIAPDPAADPAGGPGADPAADPAGGPGADPAAAPAANGTVNQQYLDAIAGVTSYEDKLRIALDYLPNGGEELTDLYYGLNPEAPDIAGVTLFPSCEVWMNASLPGSVILDILRHEYIHVLQCRIWGSDVRDHYGSNAEVERIADAGAYLLGANYLYYLQYRPFGLGPLTQWEVDQASALLQAFGISVQQASHYRPGGSSGTPEPQSFEMTMSAAGPSAFAAMNTAVFD